MEGQRSQGSGCSPVKKLRELGSNRSATKLLVIEQFEPTRKRHIAAALDSNIKMQKSTISVNS